MRSLANKDDDMELSNQLSCYYEVIDKFPKYLLFSFFLKPVISHYRNLGCYVLRVFSSLYILHQCGSICQRRSVLMLVIRLLFF